MPSKYVLSFDIGSGGMSAARFDAGLEVSGYAEIPWTEPIASSSLESAFGRLIRSAQGDEPPAAIAISSFMHSFLLQLGPEVTPRDYPVHTWMETAPPDAIAAIRNVIGPDFHRRTGCHYHPMFPVFKLAAARVSPRHRIGSPKSFLVEELTGSFVEDFGMASATGLLNLATASWDEDILRAAQINSNSLPRLIEPDAIVGKASGGRAERFGVYSDTVVVNGSGDGFMANIGSGCESPHRMAITIGTSAAVRQMVTKPALDAKAGTFCYRANSQNAFLLGCASNNGGNALDWARREFGQSTSSGIPKPDIPIFLPWLHGERSLEWDSRMRPEWHGRRADNTPEELFRSVMEGVVFNIAQYVEVIEKNSGIRASQMVLSGNGFLDPAVAPVLAAIVARETLLPEFSGLGTLRGTAVTAWRALGHDAAPSVERILARSERVVPIDDDDLHQRYRRFKEFRGVSG